MSDVGRRSPRHEDTICCSIWTSHDVNRLDGAESPEECAIYAWRQSLVLVVPDGMGGALAGDVASKMAIAPCATSCWGNNSEGPQCERTLPGRLP